MRAAATSIRQLNLSSVFRRHLFTWPLKPLRSMSITDLFRAEAHAEGLTRPLTLFAASYNSVFSIQASVSPFPLPYVL